MTHLILEKLKQKPFLIGFLITLFILILYLPSLNNYLMSDDFEWLNSVYTGWQNPSQIFQPINSFYRPLVKFTYLLNYTFFHTQTFFYNAFTVLIHLVNVFLLYILIYKITLRIIPAFFISLLYGSSALYSQVSVWSAGRPDSLLLIFMLLVIIFYHQLIEKKSSGNLIWIFIFTLCAGASKETWILLPFLAFGFLWMVKRISILKSLQHIAGLLILLFLYIGYFIILPRLISDNSFISYANSNFLNAVKKFGLLISKYFGLENFYNGTLWQITLIVLALGILLYWFIRRKNHLAQWGMLWLLITIAISLPIYHSPSRYNYLPLVGFWIMIVAWLDKDLKDLFKKFNIGKPLILIIIGIPLLFYTLQQSLMLQLEIEDFRLRGSTHKVLVDMYSKIKNQLPSDQTILFVDHGKRRAVSELAQSIKGYQKVLFVREPAIWQQVYLSPLANFAGKPFSLLLKPIPEEDLPTIMQKDFFVLVFTDHGFIRTHSLTQKIREYYNQHQKLPYKVQALHFVPTQKSE